MIDIQQSIQYEDNNIIVCNKQAGWLSQSNRSFDVDMVSALMSYRVQKGEPPYIAIINRLDRPVSGLVLFAKNKEMAAELTRELENKAINKFYFAVLCGVPKEQKGRFVDYLGRDARTNTAFVTDDAKKGRLAELEYEVQATKNVEGCPLTLVSIRLLTGRHHQIRVQFASRKLPLLGDTKYGKEIMKKGSWQNISLCAYRMEVLGRNFEIEPMGEGFTYFK